MQTRQSTTSAPPQKAPWINETLYPFETQTYQTEAGTMHYVDEGAGEVIVMVHGNPAWSFIYRKLITGLSDHYRCIVPDHIGFGQSDKPQDWTYLPQDHATNLEDLLTSLNVEDITLVVQDWGGPIGLSYAIKHPEKVKRLVILNTWMWSVKDDWYYRVFSAFMGGFVGRFLCRRFNFFARSVVASAYGDRKKLSPEIHRLYLDALPTPQARKGTWVFPQQIIGSSRWLDSLWSQRENITTKETLIVWGMKDIAFREKELQRWQSVFPHAEVHRLDGVGHYVQDEAGETLLDLLTHFLSKTQ